MIFLKLSIGILFFLLGWIYLYNPNLVLWLNKLGREYLFNDRLVLLERKKLSIVFFSFSFVILYMGYTSLGLIENKIFSANTINSMTYSAMLDFREGRYKSAISKYQKILNIEPDNMYTMKNLARAYAASGDKKNAMAIYTRLSRMYPNDVKIQEVMGKANNENK